MSHFSTEIEWLHALSQMTDIAKWAAHDFAYVSEQTAFSASYDTEDVAAAVRRIGAYKDEGHKLASYRKSSPQTYQHVAERARAAILDLMTSLTEMFDGSKAKLLTAEARRLKLDTPAALPFLSSYPTEGSL